MRKNNWKLATTSGCTLAFALLLAVAVTQSAQAQTFNVTHNFTGGLDGENPWAGLTMDRSGNLYGTAFAGGGGPCTTVYGQTGCGTVYKLTHRGSGWIFNPLYSFSGGNDGALPQLGRLTLAADGTLYGTTVVGGGGPCSAYGVAGCGTVFHLTPQPTICKSVLCPWRETVLYRFAGGGDGWFPNGGPVFDQAGNLYGTAGSYASYGDVYKLTPSGGSWTFSVAYPFSGSDGQIPIGELTFDQAGNLYGTTWVGGAYGRGTAYELTPSGSGWTDKVLHSFNDAGSDGGVLYAGLILDGSGNIFGATINGGSGGGGTVFELTPSGGSWTFNLLYSFTGGSECGVYGDLVLDSSGSLYGTTACDGVNGKGSVFKLAPSGGGTWTYSSLHDFTGGSDGGNSYSNLVFDTNGNLYGTAYNGGANGKGVVFEITP